MYAAIKSYNKDIKIIAIHDDLEVIQKFIKQENDSLSIVKIKRKEMMKQDAFIYDDKYLIRFGDKYIPFELYDTAKNISDTAEYDYDYCKDILLRISRESDLSEKECKAIARTIMILEREIEDSKNEIGSLSVLKNMKELNDKFNERINL